LTWHRCVAAVYIVGGLLITAVAVGHGAQRLDATSGWLGVVYIVGGAAACGWQMWELERERAAPAGLVLDGRAGFLLRRVAPLFIVLACLFYSSTDPSHHGWLLGVGCVLLGAGALFVSARTAALERRRGGQVLISGRRYYLAH
jgi:drug/metabolite transporter (DMT)-like permease